MGDSKGKLKEIFTLKRVLLSSIVLLVCLLWFKYIAAIVLVIAFTPLTIMVIRYSRFIPHVTADVNLGCSAFMGYAFGPVVGAIYAAVVGMISLVVNSHVKLAALVSVFLAMVGGALCPLLGKTFGLSFNHAFFIVVILRTVLAFPIYSNLGVDPVENFTHQTSQMLCNLIIYLPFFTLIYGLIGAYL